MKTLDRYIARSFLFNLVMLYVVVAALYVLLDLIVNFDEFAQAAQASGGGVVSRLVSMGGTIAGFYGPQLLLLYVYVAGMLPIGAAGFTLAALVRNRELVAMLSGGVSLRRVMAPMVVLTIAANVALVIDRELLIPPLAARLVEGHANLGTADARFVELRFVCDGNGSLFTTTRYDTQRGEMEGVTILARKPVPGSPGIFGRAYARVTAEKASWNGERGGWELVGGVRVLEPDIAAGEVERTPEVQDFIFSDLDPRTILLHERERYRQLLSTPQIVALKSKGHLVDTRELTRLQHSRLSLPVVNLLILLMGVPFFLLRTPGPLLVPALRAASIDPTRALRGE